jgi:uncharacterized protein YecE (DUF72 family)
MGLYIGCPIWSFKGWVGNFYPQGTRSGDFLREYARRLTTVEGNTTFYAVPSNGTLQRWAAEMPEGFRFCPKLPRTVSHQGKLTQRIQAAAAFMENMRQLGERLGPAFLQLPPRFSPRQFDDLKAFLEAWPREHRLAVEVRHLDWFDASWHEALNEILAQQDMARVVIDTRPIRDLKGDRILQGSVYESLLEARERKPDVPVIPERTTDFLFLRYIAHPEMEYNVAFLEEWRGYLANQLRESVDAFVFCHSPENMIAPYLCRTLYQQVAEQIPLPSLPWEDATAGTYGQERLF